MKTWVCLFMHAGLCYRRVSRFWIPPPGHFRLICWFWSDEMEVKHHGSGFLSVVAEKTQQRRPVLGMCLLERGSSMKQSVSIKGFRKKTVKWKEEHPKIKRQHCWLSGPSSTFAPLLLASVYVWRQKVLRLLHNPSATRLPHHLHTLELSKLLGTFLREGNANLLLFIVVKVAGVSRSFKLRDERSLHLRSDRGTRFREVRGKEAKGGKQNAPFSGKWRSSRWLQTTCGLWCHWLRFSGSRNVLWDPPDRTTADQMFLTLKLKLFNVSPPQMFLCPTCSRFLRRSFKSELKWDGKRTWKE